MNERIRTFNERRVAMGLQALDEDEARELLAANASAGRPPTSGEPPDFDSWEDMIENQYMIPDPPASGEPSIEPLERVKIALTMRANQPGGLTYHTAMQAVEAVQAGIEAEARATLPALDEAAERYVESVTPASGEPTHPHDGYSYEGCNCQHCFALRPPASGVPSTEPKSIEPETYDEAAERVHRAFCDPEHEMVGYWDQAMADALRRNGYAIVRSEARAIPPALDQIAAALPPSAYREGTDWTRDSLARYILARLSASGESPDD
jgi:hypothetical protein